jgi:hypothetical protein
MDPTRVWCRMMALGADGRATGLWVVRGRGRPDLQTIDSIARRALEATRAGGRLVLWDVAPNLRELLELVPLPVLLDGTVEAGGQPEGRE